MAAAHNFEIQPEVRSTDSLDLSNERLDEAVAPPSEPDSPQASDPGIFS
jgi:hypothetical protein